jgi:hypothetical protein
MNGRWLLLSFAACAVLVAEAPAAELVVRDLVVDATVLPTTFDYAVNGPLVDKSGSDHFSSGTGLSVGGRWSWAAPGRSFGVVVGGDLGLHTWTYASDGTVVDYGAHICAGPGWAVSDTWTLTLEPGYSRTWARIDLPGTIAGPAFAGSGTGNGYDVRATATWAAGETWLLRMTAGWMRTSLSASDSDTSVDIDPHGFLVAVGVAWRWSDAPPTLR